MTTRARIFKLDERDQVNAWVAQNEEQLVNPHTGIVEHTISVPGDDGRIDVYPGDWHVTITGEPKGVTA